MEQQITEMNLQLVEMSTKLEYTTGKMNETENELRDTKIELYNTMKQLVDTRNECSFYDEQLDEMRMQNLRSHNELSEYKKLNLRLQGELCRANTDVDNLKQEIRKRQNNVEQPKMNFQVNSSTHGTYINEGNEYMPQNTNSMQSVDHNHGHSGNSACNQHGNRVFGSNFQLIWHHRCPLLFIIIDPQDMSVTVTQMSLSLDCRISTVGVIFRVFGPYFKLV